MLSSVKQKAHIKIERFVTDKKGRKVAAIIGIKELNRIEELMEDASDGNLIFEGGFASLNPSYWQYDEAAQELYFIVPKVTDEMLENRIKRGRGEVKRVDRNNRSLIYDFDSKTEVFDFMGWNFFKKREY